MPSSMMDRRQSADLSHLTADTVIGVVLLVLLCFVTTKAMTMAAYFEVSNKTCGASYGRCYKPWRRRPHRR
ncbi:hypothetical protein [Nocardia sp. NPDC003979]